MNTKKLALFVLVSSGLGASTVFAATQGSLDSTSTGSSDITITINDSVKITDVDGHEVVDAVGDQALDFILEAKLEDGGVYIDLDPDKLTVALQVSRDSIGPSALSLQLPVRQRRRGVETRLIIGATQPARDDILIANIARAEQWRAALSSGDDLATIAARDGITVKYLGQMLPFAFLSPKLIRAILEGRQPPALTTNWIRRRGLPVSWADQDRILAQL